MTSTEFEQINRSDRMLKVVQMISLVVTMPLILFGVSLGVWLFIR